ncbi:hypothetical protein HYU92_04770 [Candidatus Curtissbacteria bacterium]|nr:hypothetical protein [Candidatus Curtissbacteria bacterium]
MAQVEAAPTKESFLDSRLVKAGIILAAAGLLMGAFEIKFAAKVAALGVVLFGAGFAWHWATKRN